MFCIVSILYSSQQFCIFISASEEVRLSLNFNSPTYLYVLAAHQFGHISRKKVFHLLFFRFSLDETIKQFWNLLMGYATTVNLTTEFFEKTTDRFILKYFKWDDLSKNKYEPLFSIVFVMNMCCAVNELFGIYYNE